MSLAGDNRSSVEFPWKERAIFVDTPAAAAATFSEVPQNPASFPAEHVRQEIVFPPFRLDLVNERLWRGPREIVLRPKAFAFLRYLVEQSGRLVTKKELFDAVWQGDRVSADLPRGYVQELRELLEDDAERPRLIETVRGRGYRFLASTTATIGAAPRPVQATPETGFGARLVGRSSEIERLNGALGRALNGERQTVFVSGEPGIGKTALVEVFLQGVVDRLGVRVAPGQCLEHHGSGEPYLPVLEALGRRCRDFDGERFVDVLGRYAPTWLAQMPWLIRDEDRQRLERAVAGATRERMLREVAEALEALTAEAPLILLLEDLHASDASTLDLIAFLAQRREPARLLVIGTYRSPGALSDQHPLRAIARELQIHGRCDELSLGFLTQADVGVYLARRFVPAAASPRVAKIIHERSEGNPLFMVSVVEYLVATGSFVRIDERWEMRGDVAKAVSSVPEGLRRIVERQIESLEPSQRDAMDVASVAGVEFVTSSVAAGLRKEPEAVEEICVELSEKGLVRPEGTEEWADGSIGTRYRFVHSIYQDVLYERLPATRRSRLHRQIAERQEKGHGPRAEEVAAELALHFERGRDCERAVRYLGLAAEKAIRRHAPREATAHLRRALELVETLPNTVERRRQELGLRITLGGQLIAMTGYAAAEVGSVYAQARDLCREVGQTRQLFPALHGLWLFYASRPELGTTREIASELMSLAEQSTDRELLLVAHWVRGSTRLFLGEVATGLGDLEEAIRLYDPSQHGSNALVYGQDPGASCSAFAGMATWILGYPEQALAHCQRALSLGTALSHPVGLASALACTAFVHHLRGESALTMNRSRSCVALAEKADLVFFVAWGKMLLGWALTQEGEIDRGIGEMLDGLGSVDGIGIGLSRPYFAALLAEVYGRIGRVEEGIEIVDESLAAIERTRERVLEAEIVRVKGQLVLAAHDVRLAEACFRRSFALARRQQARSFELRAMISLARLLRDEGKKAEARTLLGDAYAFFTEGLATRDLSEAAELLNAIGVRR